MTDPLDRLSSLGDGEPPPLAPAASVRARGEVRRRTARVLTGAVLGVALLAGSAVAVSTLGGAGTDSLGPAASSTPTPSPTPLTPTPDPCASPSPGDVRCDSDTPPSSAPATALSPRLVQAADVEAVVGGDWGQAPDRSAAWLGLVVCPSGKDEVTEGTIHEINRIDRSAGTFVSKVVQLSSGARELRRVRADLAECPVRDDGNERVTYDRVDGNGDEWLVVRHTRRDCRDCDTSESLVVLVSHESYVGYLSMPVAERSRLRTWVELVGRRLRGPAGTAPATTGPAWDPGEALLTPQEASRAEQPGLASKGFSGESEPLLDPCGEGTELTEGADRTAEVRYESRREAGGSSLVQRAARFGSGPEARRAAEAYVDRVRRCPVVKDDPMGEPSETRYAVVERRDDSTGLAVLVRRVPCRAEGCTDHFATYVLVVATRDGVAVAGYAIGEDGDPREDAESLLAALAEKLAATTA